ncbi:MAG: hypothetical protein J6T98_13325 [Salinivirgaceae bacterium]|nr:hypothetical protein [Salinivirgaceae bacterium]
MSEDLRSVAPVDFRTKSAHLAYNLEQNLPQLAYDLEQNLPQLAYDLEQNLPQLAYDLKQIYIFAAENK